MFRALCLISVLFTSATAFGVCRTQDRQKICENEEGTITRIDSLDKDERVLERQLFDVHSGELEYQLKLDYERNPFSDDWISGFEEYDAKGELLRRFHNEQLSGCEASANETNHKVLVAEIFGIDLSHELLEGKTLKSLKGAPSQGQCAGFYLSDADQVRPHVVKNYLPSKGKIDVDHGTLVGSLITKDLEKAKIYPASGNFKSARFYESAQRAIRDHDMRLANFSLSFRDLNNPHLSWRDQYGEAKSALSEMIEQNPGTLFVAASGNGRFNGFNVDAVNLSQTNHYPAGFSQSNIFSVGAIHTDKLEEENLSDYRMSYFSNYSLKRVDILAPGSKLKAAKVGSGYGRGTGTSFATPFIVNEILKIANMAPRLDYFAIRELMMKTVYIPDIDLALKIDPNWKGTYTKSERYEGEWFPVRSGGIYYRTKAYKAARLMQENPSLSLDEVLSQIYSPEELAKRQKLWSKRKINLP